MKISFKQKFASKTQFEIYLDKRIWGVLPKKLLTSFIQKEEIDNEEFKELKEILYKFTLNKLLNYLAKQEHSEYESRKYLKKNKIHPSLIDKVIDFCLTKKYISDSRLTEVYVRSLIELGKSKNEITYKLRSKGVDVRLIEEELENQYDKQAKEFIISENLDRAIRIYTSRESKDIYNKCCAYMMRKGFFYSDFSDQLKNKLNYSEDEF